MNTLDNIISTYQTNVDKTEQELAKETKRIYRVGTLRLILFIAGITGFFYFYHTLWLAITVACLIFIPFFLLIKVHNRMFNRKAYLEQFLKVNQQELKAIDYDPSEFDDGNDYKDPSHPYTFDIDIFGTKSLFQYANRSVTSMGRNLLAQFFCRPFDKKTDIEQRQKTIQELSNKISFRQEFRTNGLLFKGNPGDIDEIIDWNKTPNYFNSRPYYQFVRWIVPFINFVLFLLAFLGVLSFTIPCLSVVLFVILSIGLTQHISKVQSSFETKLHILNTYGNLLSLIEDEQFNSDELMELKHYISSNGISAYHAIKQLTRRMNALDQRNNIFVTAILNGLFFWELQQIMYIEAWKDRYGKYLLQWFDCISKMDTLCSLGTYTYNNPDFHYPAISISMMYKAQSLKHPLMNRDHCVPNDIDMEGAPRFTIVTGANMAGKSTYLRTIGINQLLACMGLPVDAEQMTIYPYHLVTSLRTDDSLKDNESYFFAELKRLKMIIDKLHSGERLFIILDEILRGTNSADKQLGSYSFVKQLVEGGATGLIATHDLQLARLQNSFPDFISTKCFEADITDDNLTFSYKLRDGIAQNMNACFLMKKMGIDVVEPDNDL